MPPAPDPEVVLTSDKVFEALAAIEHERWAHWQRYVHDHCEQQPDGSLLIPADLARQWSTQIETPYSDLSEAEKNSDRDQVRRYLPTIVEVLARANDPN